MTTFNDQLVQIVEDYRACGEAWPATRDQIAEWAVANERYQLTRGMAVRQCADHLTRAMRLEHVKDERGRSIRRYYAARVREDDNQLRIKWDDLNAPRDFMEISSANRRNHILGECRQLKDDMDSYSERICPYNPIQIDFNFNVDLEEMAALNEDA